MDKVMLWVIKVIVILVVIALMAGAKKIGIPIIAANIVGFAIIVMVFRYKPEQTSDIQELNKKIDNE